MTDPDRGDASADERFEWDSVYAGSPADRLATDETPREWHVLLDCADVVDGEFAHRLLSEARETLTIAEATTAAVEAEPTAEGVVFDWDFETARGVGASGAVRLVKFASGDDGRTYRLSYATGGGTAQQQ